MIDRKKRLRIIQIFLITVGVLIIYFTYYTEKNYEKDKIISRNLEKKSDLRENKNPSADGDVFFNIEYTGLDLNGNRYILKSEEAFLDKIKPEIVYMTTVKATFYFKDNTVLYIWANKGIYNNKTLDMSFKTDVKAKYLESNLFADNAQYSNSDSFLSIFGNVKIDDIQGNLIADKLLFDITEQKLDITSFNNGKINANVKLNEKRF